MGAGFAAVALDNRLWDSHTAGNDPRMHGKAGKSAEVGQRNSQNIYSSNQVTGPMSALIESIFKGKGSLECGGLDEF